MSHVLNDFQAFHWIDYTFDDKLKGFNYVLLWIESIKIQRLIIESFLLFPLTHPIGYIDFWYLKKNPFFKNTNIT